MKEIILSLLFIIVFQSCYSSQNVINHVQKNPTIDCACESRECLVSKNGPPFLEFKDEYKNEKERNTLKTKIVEINFDKSYIQLEDGIITYTTDDFFVILRDKNILRVNSLDLNNGDYLIMG